MESYLAIIGAITGIIGAIMGVAAGISVWRRNKSASRRDDSEARSFDVDALCDIVAEMRIELTTVKTSLRELQTKHEALSILYQHVLSWAVPRGYIPLAASDNPMPDEINRLLDK